MSGAGSAELSAGTVRPYCRDSSRLIQGRARGAARRPQPCGEPDRPESRGVSATVRGGLPGTSVRRVTVDPAEPSRELPDASPDASPDVPRRRFPRLRRFVRLALASAAVVLAVVLVTLFSVDLGPWLRGQAEQRGAAFLKREFHIGGLSARLLSGRFVVSDLSIGGLEKGDRPFFTAKRITVHVPWWTIISRNLIVEDVEISDWHMTVETFKDGRHNFPKFTRDGPKGPKRFVTTVRSVKATRGTFELQDHGAPWSIVAPNLEVAIRKADTYRGTADFDKATIQIARFEPMWARATSRFRIDGGKIVVEGIDLVTDGAVSHAVGEVDTARWPEQTYAVRSRIDFPRMKELFWARDQFTLTGTGEFAGTYHLFKGGRELSGRFASLETRLNDWRFAGMEGSLVWTRDRFEVMKTRSGFYGGKLAIDFSMKPLGDPLRPGIARLETAYEDVDVAGADGGARVRRPAARRPGDRAQPADVAAGPIPRAQRRRRDSCRGGDGAAGSDAARRRRRRARKGWRARSPCCRRSSTPRASRSRRLASRRRFPLVFTTPIGGAMRYTYGPEWVTFAPGWIATASTYVELQGRTAWGDRSTLPFHVTSGDWQESDQWLTAVMTAFGSPARPVPVGGAGRFDGTMTGAFRRPRVEGRFAGERMRAWDVEWGAAAADLVVENSYVDIAGARITRGLSTMDVDGRFSLGFPRKDRGEELNARVRMTGRPVEDFKHAFELDDYQVDGALSGEFRVYGPYRGPFGFGRMQIDTGSGLRRGLRDRVGGAALRGHRRPPRHAGRAQVDRQRHRRRVRRLGRHLLVQRRRPARPGREPGGGALPEPAAHRPARLLRDRQRHVRRAALQRARPRRRSLRRRGRARPAHRPHRSARRRAEHRPARRRLAPPRRLRRRAASRCRRLRDADLTLRFSRTSIDPVRAPPRAAPVAVHHGRGERRLPRRRAAARHAAAQPAGIDRGRRPAPVRLPPEERRRRSRCR